MYNETRVKDHARRTLRIGFAVGLLLGVILTATVVQYASTAFGTTATAYEVSGDAVIELDPFVVNLADASPPRFLRIKVAFVVADTAAAARVKGDETRMLTLRSNLLDLLRSRTAVSVAQPSAKRELGNQIADQFSRSVPGVVLEDVLFSEFVLQ